MYAENFHSLTADQMCSLSPKELKRIANSEAYDCESEKYSKKIAEYSRRRPEVVHANALVSLTNSDIVYSVCPSVSWLLLNLAYFAES